jgi:hypothetical protein
MASGLIVDVNSTTSLNFSSILQDPYTCKCGTTMYLGRHQYLYLPHRRYPIFDTSIQAIIASFDL